MIRNAVFNALRGFCMGAADVVPGVSGGTMALVLGIYTRLMYALRSFDLTLVRLLMKRDLGAAVRHVDLLLLLPLGAFVPKVIQRYQPLWFGRGAGTKGCWLARVYYVIAGEGAGYPNRGEGMHGVGHGSFGTGHAS